MDSLAIRKFGSALLLYSVAILFTLIALVPLAWAFGTSLKTYGEVFARPYAFIPLELQWDNYAAIFRAVPFARYFVNTVLVSAFACLFTLITSAMSGYAFARLKFPGRETIFMLYLALLIIPPQVILIPNFIVMRELGLLDTLTALVLTRSFWPLGVFLLRQFFFGVPRELEEAAIMDGYGYARRFLFIILPLAKPALVTLFILTLLLVWNDFLYPLVFIQSDANRTLTLGLSILQGDLDVQWNLVMAAVVLAISPLVVIYLSLQRFFIEGIALSGTKG